MNIPEDPDHVRPALRRAEVEIAHHLDEACEERDVDISEESTDELLRLEEELLAAARAVEQAVQLRKQLGDAKEGAGKQVAAPEPPPAETTSSRVREFRTASGSEWRVWEVRPGAGGRPRKLELYPGDYAQGWLAFELLNGDRRKRLPKFAPNWSAAPDADLERFLDQAVEVPKRKERPGVPKPPSSGESADEPPGQVSA
jgi:hypothetical protein